MVTGAANEPSQGPLTRAEYDELVTRGAFDDARVELLYGRVVPISPIGPSHRYSVTRLAKLLIRALGDRAGVHVQSPFAAPNESEPEPDIAIVPPGDYLDDHPQSAWLIIEVADSSLGRDRAKARLYAAAGVPEYWIVNLVDETIEVHRAPGHAAYAHHETRVRGDVLRVMGDVDVPVSEILPPKKH